MNTSVINNNEEALLQLRSTYSAIIAEVIPDLEEHYYLLPLEEVRVDSIDMMAIRTELEKASGSEIPDHEWINFKSLDEIITYCAHSNHSNGINDFYTKAKEILQQNQIVINMPQMAIEALSESWLFKELGHRHWQMLCRGLATNSHEIADEAGNRLYATFVRIQVSASASLNAFSENDKIGVNEKMERYGMGMYLSEIGMYSLSCLLKSRLLTSFSLRNSDDNTRLNKSQPFTAVNNIIAVTDLPAFVNEYRNIKKGLQDHIFLGGEIFRITDDTIFETEYNINPYYDLNGVGLLYFAAYPIINDTCEAKYFNVQPLNVRRWETNWFTRDRDIFYYGNCNVNDAIIYKLHSVEFPEKGIVKTYSSLHRKKDGSMIAQVFTVKIAR